MGLRMGAVFALMGGFVNWFPLIVGLTINPKWLKVQFMIIFLGVNMTFFPIHFLGLAGMPRRYSDYPDRFMFCNVIARVGSIISIVSVIFFFIHFMRVISKASSSYLKKPYKNFIRNNTFLSSDKS